jgi:hypothetical protein
VAGVDPELGEDTVRCTCLTPREREVVALTAEGYTAAEIGETLPLGKDGGDLPRQGRTETRAHTPLRAGEVRAARGPPQTHLSTRRPVTRSVVLGPLGSTARRRATADRRSRRPPPQRKGRSEIPDLR